MHPSLRILLPAALASACSIKHMLPSGPVVGPAELSAFSDPRPPDISYAGEPRLDFPVLPLQIFGLYYDVDIVLVSQHPDWDMHEYARVQSPEGPIWLAKDARPTGEQGIVADLPHLDRVLPEAPVPRFEDVVRVDDRSRGRHLDVGLAYTNADGEEVVVRYRGAIPRKPPRKRNGSTMGHSRQVAAAVLDLHRFGLGGRASIEIGGAPVKLERALGLVPLRLALRQAQGGVVATDFVQRPTDQGFRLQRPGPAPTDPFTGEPGWPTQGVEAWTATTTEAVFQGPWTTMDYRFVEGGLASATLHQHGVEAPVFELRFAQALPDLRRPFAGTHSTVFVMHVHGQQGHGTGTLSARWTDANTVELVLLPTEPWWLADRPMVGTLHYSPEDQDQVHVRWTRDDRAAERVLDTPGPAWPGTSAP